jgi:hypothetical protein
MSRGERMSSAANDARRSNDRKQTDASRARSRLVTVARLLGAPAAAYLAVVGVVHAFDSPEAPGAMPPGSVLVVLAAEVSTARATACDFDCD